MFFLPVLILWVVASLWVGSSLGAKFKFLEDLRTHILADYSPDPYNQSFKSLRLAIFGEVISDSELPSDVMSSLEKALQGPVPTATHMGGSSAPTFTPIATATIEPHTATDPTATPSLTSTPKDNPDEEPTANPPWTPTPTKIVPTATPEPEKVEPLLECILDHGDGTYTAVFGYKNHNSYQVEFPIGERNKFSPGDIDRGQPTQFEPGHSSEYPNASFLVVFDGEALTWHLDGGSVTASENSNLCVHVPHHQENDSEPPQLSDGDLDPPPGDLSVCSLTITVNHLRVVDPAPSSGIAWVKLKYNVEGYTTDYIYSNPLTLCSGGPTEDGGWDGCYSGSILIEIDPTWVTHDSEPFRINLKAKAQDNEGNSSCYSLGQYTMPASCGTSE